MTSQMKIDMVIRSTDSAFDANKIPKKYKQNFLLTLRSFLTQDGIMENVCPTCMGSGKK